MFNSCRAPILQGRTKELKASTSFQFSFLVQSAQGSEDRSRADERTRIINKLTICFVVSFVKVQIVSEGQTKESEPQTSYLFCFVVQFAQDSEGY